MEKIKYLEKLLGEDIMEILNDSDIKIDGGYVSGEDIVVITRFYSPLGEYVLFDLIFDGTRLGFVKGFRCASLAFDADDHAVMQIKKRERDGVPGSIREIIDDAVWEKEFLLSVSKELQQLNGKGGNEA